MYACVQMRYIYVFSTCMHACICTHIRTLAYTLHTPIHVQTSALYVYVRMYIHLCMYIIIYTHRCMHTHLNFVCVHACTYILFIHVYVSIYNIHNIHSSNFTHVCMYKYLHTHTHTHIYIYIHTHTRTQLVPGAASRSITSISELNSREISAGKSRENRVWETNNTLLRPKKVFNNMVVQNLSPEGSRYGSSRAYVCLVLCELCLHALANAYCRPGNMSRLQNTKYMHTYSKVTLTPTQTGGQRHLTCTVHLLHAYIHCSNSHTNSNRRSEAHQVYNT
jgi:hypothetical protein